MQKYDVPQYEYLQITKTGRVFMKDRIITCTRKDGSQYSFIRKGRELKQSCDKDGYLQVYYRDNYKHVDPKVHRLLALTFIPNLHNYPLVNHIDGNKQNNELSNLEWCTNKYNAMHGKMLKNIKEGKDYVLPVQK